MPTVRGCHLVGSVPLKDTQAVFESLHSLQKHLKRYPDGETADRKMFVSFQAHLFPEFIQTKLDFSNPLPPKSRVFTDQEIEKGKYLLSLKGKEGIKTGYDDAAIESYGIFKDWKESGKFSHGARFQVSIPTLGNVVGSFISPQFQEEAEKIYEPALFEALRNIQEKIPHKELAIQLDMGVDMLYWVDGWAKPWWSDKDHLVGYIVKMANEVKPDVELGFHFCYGDIAHQHTIEPDSLQGVSDFALRIFNELKRPATYMHCPVPLSAEHNLEAYFKPLETLLPVLHGNGTELFLGLIHAGNRNATRKMIKSACQTMLGFNLGEFGISTECGWGRTPRWQLASIKEISLSESKPLF
ncbi:hypothetical protein V2G26_007346 [Clonostachys chloroleuca]